jgi:hypothetical protein
LKHAIDNGEDPNWVAEDFIGYIAKEPGRIQRHAMIEQLAAATRVPYPILDTSVQDALSTVG